MKRLTTKLHRIFQNAWYSFLLFFTYCMLFLLTFIPGIVSSQATGLWRAIGDIDGDEKAIIEIFEKDNKLFGKVIKLTPASKHTVCDQCSGDLKDKPITGMIIMQDLVITSTGGEKGRILDPGSGRMYNCFIELLSPDKLKLRAYFGIPSIGRTQYWYRVSS